jgi:hypothetical protein
VDTPAGAWVTGRRVQLSLGSRRVLGQWCQSVEQPGCGPDRGIGDAGVERSGVELACPSKVWITRISTSCNSAVSALRFFFTVTLDRSDLARRLTVVPYPRRIDTGRCSAPRGDAALRAATEQSTGRRSPPPAAPGWASCAQGFLSPPCRATADKGCEWPDVSDTVAARLLAKTAHGHVFDHLHPQRADGRS